MSDTVRFTIGATATCTDGTSGTLRRIVVDPITRRVTHLVVEPKHRQGLGRLVPLDRLLVGGDALLLQCTQEQFNEFPTAEETQFLTGADSFESYDTGDVLYHPYYTMNVGAGPGTEVSGIGLANLMEPITLDLIPAGEVAIERGESVHATDGDIGKVQGLIIDPHNGKVTHVLLQEGHLWGKREVAIPIESVVSVDHGVRLSLSKEDLGKLPAVDVTDLMRSSS